MALPLITINIQEPKDEDAALKQLAAAVVASAFNDYLTLNMHRWYVAQVVEIRGCLMAWKYGEDEKAQEYLDRAIRMMGTSYFRRVKQMRNKILSGAEWNAAEYIDVISEIIQEEEIKEYSSVRVAKDRLQRFFDGPLLSLYSGDTINKHNLQQILAHLDEVIEKEKERLR